jgi:hypothetical protein
MKQIELELGGQKRTFYFGLGFLGNLLEKESVSIDEIDQKIVNNPFKWMPLIMYYSCAWGFTRKNENPPFDVFDITEWVDEAGIDSTVVVDFFTAFRQSLVKDVPPTKDKKKVTIK